MANPNISISYSIDAAKQRFIREEQLQQGFEDARKRILLRAGGLIRKIARSSIKARKWKKFAKRPSKSGKTHYIHDYLDLRALTSQPGQPPFAHTSKGEFGIKTILFAYDNRTDSVIVGPVGRPSAYSVPQALEYGGVTVVRVPSWARKRSRIQGKSKIVKRIKARPFMRPALEKFQKEYPQLWRDAIRVRRAA